jgi:hypothetical protein
VASEQVATFLFSALLASESLLISAFGTLVAAHMRAIAEAVVNIAIVTRQMCYLISFTIVVISLTNLYMATYLSETLDKILPHIVLILYLIVILIAIPPLVIARRMYIDASPK